FNTGIRSIVVQGRHDYCIRLVILLPHSFMLLNSAKLDTIGYSKPGCGILQLLLYRAAGVRNTVVAYNHKTHIRLPGDCTRKGLDQNIHTLQSLQPSGEQESGDTIFGAVTPCQWSGHHWI